MTHFKTKIDWLSNNPLTKILAVICLLGWIVLLLILSLPSDLNREMDQEIIGSLESSISLVFFVIMPGVIITLQIIQITLSFLRWKKLDIVDKIFFFMLIVLSLVYFSYFLLF